MKGHPAGSYCLEKNEEGYLYCGDEHNYLQNRRLGKYWKNPNKIDIISNDKEGCSYVRTILVKDDLSIVDKECLKYSSIEEFLKVKKLTLIKFPELSMKLCNIFPMYNALQTIPSSLFLNYINTTELGKVFVPGRFLNLIVDSETKTVEGEADGIDMNGKFINPIRNISSEKAYLVKKNLFVPREIIDRYEIVP